MKTREVFISEILDVLQAASGEDVHLKFLYGGYLHETGVRIINGRKVYYFNDEDYPSMLSFKCGACIEDISLAELRDKVQLIAEL